MLGQDRGPTLEVIVSRMNYMAAHVQHPVRLVGLSTALANADDVAAWLGVGKARRWARARARARTRGARSVDLVDMVGRGAGRARAGRPVQLSAVRAARPARGAHQRLCRKALLPAHGHHEQAGLQRHQDVLADQAGHQYASAPAETPPRRLGRPLSPPCRYRVARATQSLWRRGGRRV